MKKIEKKIIAFVLVVSFCLGSVNLKVSAHENTKVQSLEQVELVSENGELDDIQLEKEYFDNKCTIYETERFRVVNCLTDCWEGGFNASFVVENTSDMDIRNWYIQFPAQFAIANIWNAEIEREQDGVYLVKNVEWNSIIEAGGRVQFGVTVYENFTEFPDTDEVLGTNVKVAEDAYEIAYEIYNDWDTGFTGAITISNKSETVIEDWKLAFDFENEFTDIWNAEIVSHSGIHYELLNVGYNSNIRVGESVSVGFVVGNGDAEKVLTSSSLSAFSLEGSMGDEQTDTQDNKDGSYVKDATEEDIIFDKEGGVHYVKNQIIVSTHLGASKELMSNLAKELGADIVGYIELTEDYQLEFREEMTYTELIESIAYVKCYPFVKYAGLNLATRNEIQYFSNDALYHVKELWVTESYDTNNNGEKEDKERINIKKTKENDGIGNDGWSNYIAAGNNWGLEALNVHKAWDYRNLFSSSVKVGIYDNMFGQNEDLAYSAIYENPGKINSVHGTHVAGIIGAKFDNKIGISGVATDAKLYAYAFACSTFSEAAIIEKLVKKGVRIINYSCGYPSDITYSATIYKTGKAHELVMRESTALQESLKSLINQGYDFLLVASAGNANGVTFVKDPDGVYEYSVYDEVKHKGLRKVVGTPDAKYNSRLTAIEDPYVKNRIIVVGAVEHIETYLKTDFNIADFSQEGSRVDTYAPGIDILSTVPKVGFCDAYMTMTGTSMATPHITGLAALMLQANPNLRAEQIKNIIMNENGVKLGYKKYMPDAEKCVLKALNMSK